VERKKHIRYKCPECGGAVIWSHNNLRAGSTSTARCSNNASVSRTDWIPAKSRLCLWTGVTQRRRGGKIDLFHEDGITRIRKVFLVL